MPEPNPAAGAVHRLDVRVYYEDTDAGGIVYHANYLRFAERARTEMLRTLGFQQSLLLQQEGIAFAVTRCEVDFRAPARLDDRLSVVSRVADCGAASIRFDQSIQRDGQTLVMVVVRVACISREGRAVRMPAVPRG